MHRRPLLFIVFSLLFSLVVAQVSIAPYYGGRQAALSLTFDDGLEDQYTLAWPELKKRGLRATFAIIGSKVGGVVHSKQDRIDGSDGTPCMTWEMVREMAADGQEIASHGWEHRAVTRLSPEALRHEVQANDSAIYKETGLWPATFVYPGNNKSPEVIAYCEQERVGSRTFQTSLGSKRTGQFLQAYIDTLLSHREWGVTMTHGIARGYDHFADPQVMWDCLDYIQSKSSELWVAPFRDVAAYIRERDDARLNVTPTDDGFSVSIATGLSPQLFCHPLTLVVPDHVTSATQDGHQLTLTHKNSNTLIDVNPHGGAITLMCSHRSALREEQEGRLDRL